MEIEIKFFSQQIRNLREEHQWTQEELAHQLGVSRQSIISLERGRCLPSLPLALSLADVFDLMLEDFFQPHTAMPSPEMFEILEQENEWLAQINLPENIDQDKIQAELKDGVLTLTLPKNPPIASKVTKIKVKKS